VPLGKLLRGSSCAAEQRLHRLDASLVADSAICAFSPNALDQPGRASIQYIGGYPYRDHSSRSVE
jgi:hypothetical protein